MLELVIFICLGLFIYLLFLLRDKKVKDSVNDAEASVKTKAAAVEVSTADEGEECCGQHLVCERDSLLNSHAKIEYYDDEELDVLAGVSPDDYTEEQVQMLQSVFYTLRESDVAGWVRSLQTRNIELTPELREEALLIVRERRGASPSKS